MQHVSGISKAFAISAGLFVLAGCTTLPQLNSETCMEEEQTRVLFGLLGSSKRTYNQGCALQLGAGRLIESNDLGLKAVGHTVLEQQQGQVHDASEVVRRVIREETTGAMSCEVQSVDSGVDGKRIVMLGNCTPVSP